MWKKLSLNLFVATLFSSAIGGLLATLAVRYGVGLSADKISIGNIMLVIPAMILILVTLLAGRKKLCR